MEEKIQIPGTETRRDILGGGGGGGGAVVACCAAEVKADHAP